MSFIKKHLLPVIIFFTMLTVYSETLKFTVDVGSDKNYFIQNSDGAFHLLLGQSPYTRCLLASPAGNSGFMITFEDKAPLKLEESPKIKGKEKVTFQLSNNKARIANLAILGSIRIVRCYTEGGGISNTFNDMKKILKKLKPNSDEYVILSNWLYPKWELSNNEKTVNLKIFALDGINWYELTLQSDSGKFKITEDLKPSIGINSKLEIPEGKISITYSSSFKPLTPFPLTELFNKKALNALKELPEDQQKDAQLKLNALRFLAYKEKFLAGSWRFLTYFGRDTLLSLRMLAPIVTPEAIEAEFRGISERLNAAGEVSHEEDLGDQALIDQLNIWSEKADNNQQPSLSVNKIINNYHMVDSNFLTIPLLMDYYYIGGKKLFSAENKSFVPILKNLNFALTKAQTLRPIPLNKGMKVGDWRDSETGLGNGLYSFSVNAAMIPAAILSIDKLLSEKAWNESDIIKAAKENNFKALEEVLLNKEKYSELKSKWLSMWKKFHVIEPEKEMIKYLNSNRKDLGFPELKEKSPYTNGFLALSLDKNERPIPILQSDTLFMILDFPVKNEWLNLACKPFDVSLPDGLMSSAGILVASPALAPEKYRQMFDKNHYHGQVIWAWPQLMLKIALQKQIGQWVTPSPTDELTVKDKRELNKLLKEVSELINNLQQWSTSELWTWELNQNDKVVPIAYGQKAGNDTESNAIQLWSVAALGVQLWDQMNKK